MNGNCGWTCVVVWISVAVVAAADPLPPGFPPGTRSDFWNDPRYQEALKRLAKVREWQATIDVKTDYATTRAPPQHPEYSFHKFVRGHLRSSVRGTFKLRRDPHASNTAPYWDSDGHAQMSVDFEVHTLDAPDSKSPPNIPTGDTCKGAGRIKVGSDSTSTNFGIQPDGKVYLHFNGHDLEVETSGEMIIVGNGMPIRSTHRTTAELHLNIHDIPLPSGDNLRLQGVKQVAIGVPEGAVRPEYALINTIHSHGGIYGIWDLNNPPRAATIKYDLVPVVENLKLNVFIDEYDAWIPEGNKEAAEAGNELKIRAELKTLADAPPEVKAHRIKFELEEVSDEPGTAMNWPRGPGLGTNLKDLRFDPARNGNLDIPNAMGLEAVTKFGEHDRAEAVLSAYDYGAFGTLKVTAELPYGIVVGKLVYNNKEEILLPKRAKNDSKIADAWKQRQGVSELGDDTDRDDKPKGDGFAGDGLSLYQEYRGFFEKGEHVRTDPKKRDLFVKDEIDDGRTRRGLQLFQQVTELAVHYELEDDELGTDRVINVNRGTAHIENQHGVRLTQTEDAAEAQSVLGYGVRGRAIYGPGTPGDVPRVVTDAERIPGVFSSGANRRNYAAHITHELLHAVNVYHHGDGDIQGVQWTAVPRAGPDGTIVYQLQEQDLTILGQFEGPAYPIDAYLEGTTTPVPTAPFLTAQNLYLAIRQSAFDSVIGYSQHGGVEDCFMRYCTAHAVSIGRRIRPERYWLDATVREAERAQLCDSQTASDLIGRRYGNAALNRGNCREQIRVNDFGPTPER